jgi:S1-C subfamily serine protease
VETFFNIFGDYQYQSTGFLVLTHLGISNYSGRNVVILMPHRLYMINNTGQILIPILVLVSIVGLSFAYVGSLTNSSSPTVSQGQPWLGISAVEVTPQIAEATGLGETTGLLVLQVAPGGPADKAAIRGGNELKAIDGGEIPVGGDVITHIEGSAIRTLEDFQSKLSNKQIGDTVEFTLVAANGDERTVDAILEARPA